MIITISGKAGSGKGTIAKMLVDKIGYEYISIGDIKRQLATKMKINIIEFNKLGDANPAEFDLKYEEFQKGLPVDSNIILESRMSFYCQPHAFKVFLDVDIDIAAQRIYNHKRATDNYQSLEEVKRITQERNSTDATRLANLYKINCFDPQNFDLIIDTSDKTPTDITNIIIGEFHNYIKD